MCCNKHFFKMTAKLKNNNNKEKKELNRGQKQKGTEKRWADQEKFHLQGKRKMTRKHCKLTTKALFS